MTTQPLSIKEKIGYSLGDLSANLVFQTLITYLAYFYTDIYGLEADDAELVRHLGQRGLRQLAQIYWKIALVRSLIVV